MLLQIGDSKPSQSKSKPLLFNYAGPTANFHLKPEIGFLVVSLCIKIDFYFRDWTLCASGPFYLLQYQRDLSARCSSVETEISVRG